MEQPPPSAHPVTQRTSGLAIVSLICGLSSFIVPILPAFVAIFTGHISRSKIKKSGGAIVGKGMALSGLICAYASLFLITSTVTWLIYDHKKSKRIEAEEIAEEIKDGKEIYQLVLKYEADHGKFPDKLSELVEKGYVSSLDHLQPTRGENWIYFKGLTSKSPSYKYFIRSHSHKVCIYVDGTDGSRDLSFTLEPIDFPVRDHEMVTE